MIQLDLITGFLGSGKTTLIRSYAAWLMGQGLRVGILENDFGAVNVDMLLLGDLEKAGCGLEMIAGGCDRESHRRRFRTKLIAMGMSGYDRVLVEPSGIYDVDEFFDALFEEPLDRWYEAGNVIAVVDGRLEEELPEAAEYLLASETACAGRLVFSRVQEASGEELAASLAHVNRALEAVKCRRRFRMEEVLCRDWSSLSAADFQALSSCGYRPEDYQKQDLDQASVFDSMYFMERTMTPEQLKKVAAALLADPACGYVFRVKGFVRTPEGGWWEVNATRRECAMKPAAAGQEVLIVIGEGLVREEVERCLDAFGKEEG